MYNKWVMYFNWFLLAFSDTKATVETGEAGEGAGQQQEPQVEQQDEHGEELEGAVGGDPVDDPLGGVGANEEVQDDNDDEDNNDEDNEYEDEYDAEEEAYLNQFINKDSVVSKGQRANGSPSGSIFQNLFWLYLFLQQLWKKDRAHRSTAGKRNYAELIEEGEEQEMVTKSKDFCSNGSWS